SIAKTLSRASRTPRAPLSASCAVKISANSWCGSRPRRRDLPERAGRRGHLRAPSACAALGVPLGAGSRSALSPVRDPAALNLPVRDSTVRFSMAEATSDVFDFGLVLARFPRANYPAL